MEPADRAEIEEFFAQLVDSLDRIAAPNWAETAVAIFGFFAAGAAMLAVYHNRRASERAMTEQRRLSEESLAEQRRLSVLPVVADITAEVRQGFERLGLDLRSVNAQVNSPRAGGDANRWAVAAESAFDLVAELMRLSVVIPINTHADYLRTIAAYIRKVGITCARESGFPDDPPTVHDLLERLRFMERQYGSQGMLEGRWTEEAGRLVAVYSREVELMSRTLIHEGQAAADSLDLHRSQPEPPGEVVRD